MRTKAIPQKKTFYPSPWAVEAPSSASRKRPVGSPFTELGSFDGDYGHGGIADRAELQWKCLGCGELRTRNHWVLGPCPSCGAPKNKMELVFEG